MFTSSHWRSKHVARTPIKSLYRKVEKKNTLSSNVHQNVGILRVIIVNAQRNVCSRVKIEIN